MTTAYLIPEAVFAKLAARLRQAHTREQRVAVLRQLCAVHRINALGAIVSAGRGWLGASFSCTEILTALYWDVADIAPGRESQDAVVLGKGHAAAMQYAILAGRGFFPVEDLRRYKQPDGPQAHTDLATPGIAANTGSLGQALSKCAGLALGQPHRVFALLGDGELQEGQNYEALMTLRQHNLANLTVIVDCNRIQSDSNVADVKALPDLGALIAAFGLRALTVDGNDIAAVADCLHEAVRMPQPVVILAHTLKGAGVRRFAAAQTPRRGYAWHGGVPDPVQYAEALRELALELGDDEVRAGVERFVREHGAAVPRPPGPRPPRSPSTGDAFGEALVELVREGWDLFALDADLEKACRLTAFARQYPERFLEMGIAEQDMVSVAGGLALRGHIPVVNTYAAFLRRACEQVYVNASERTRIVYAGHYAGLCYGPDGKTHQCTGDVAMMRSIPGMTVLYPAFPEQVAPMLRWYLQSDTPGPLYMRLHRSPRLAADVALPSPGPFDPTTLIRVRERPGSGAAVVTCGPHMTAYCAQASDRLAAAGLGVDVWTVPVLRGLPPSAVDSLLAYATLVAAEELVDAGGLLDELSRLLAHLDSPLAPRLRSLAVDSFTFSTLEADGLYRHFGMTAEALAERLRALLMPGPAAPGPGA